MRGFKNVFGRKIGKGRFALPLWTVGLAAMAIAAVAGQAVGPVLAGSVSGSVNLVVEQTVRLGDPGSITSAGHDDFASTVNDEGTGFTVALETDIGQNQSVTFTLYNDSGQTANSMLQLNVPAGIDVELDSDGGVTEAQMNVNTWLITIPASTDGSATMTLEIESKDDARPGFYTITGQLVQISG